MGRSFLQNTPMERFTPLQGCDILVIAGETSGDEHASVLVAKLKARNPALRIAALGGRRLAETDIVMLDDLTAHARVGVWEVIKHLGVFLRLIGETVRWIETNKPKMVLFVDFVGFNLEVAQRLFAKKLSRKASGDISLYFYVSPQIWAWKAQRRFKIAKWIDSLGTIFPFEPAYYADTTLDVKFVGHPFVEEHFVNPLGYAATAPVVLLPGSRRAIVKKHLPLLLEAFRLHHQNTPTARAVIYYSSEPLRVLMVTLMRQHFALHRQPKKLRGFTNPSIAPVSAPQIAFYPSGTPLKASAALCTAGTISLTCALAGIPGFVFYKTDALTFAYGKRVYQHKYLGMANLLLKRPVMPEFWQDEATPVALARALDGIAGDPAAAEAKAKQAAAEISAMLRQPTKENAVEWVEGGLK